MDKKQEAVQCPISMGTLVPGGEPLTAELSRKIINGDKEKKPAKEKE